MMNSIQMLDKKEEGEADVEVTRIDQNRINQFSKLNAKIDDLTEEKEKMEKEKEYLDDVAMELELVDEDEVVRYKVGEAFMHIPVSEALERVSKETENLAIALEEKTSEINSVVAEMDELKELLKEKFGNAINLEKD